MSTCPTETLYWGMKLYELLTLIGIIIGPIVAVLITIVVESIRRTRESRIQIMRVLLNTRHMVADPAYSTAINLVPVEFNKEEEIMSAWRAYIEAVRHTPLPENEASQLRIVESKQTALIFQIMRRLGFNLSETDIQISAYAAGGLVSRDTLYLNSLKAMCSIAHSFEQQNKFIMDQSSANQKEVLAE